MTAPKAEFVAGALPVQIFDAPEAMGATAAHRAARVLNDAVAERGSARAILATGNSQFPFITALRDEDVPWEKVTVFHMDEYVGVTSNHPASFQRWIRERVADTFHPAAVDYIDGMGNPQAECDRYEALLTAGPIDLVCMGIGENGHLAFNEPYESKFDDDRLVRIITLTEESRQQQVSEGHFPDIPSVPATAISLTIPALLNATAVQVCAPESRKAAAVRATIQDPVSNACPATILRETPHALLLLDTNSASQLDLS